MAGKGYEKINDVKALLKEYRTVEEIATHIGRGPRTAFRYLEYLRGENCGLRKGKNSLGQTAFKIQVNEQVSFNQDISGLQISFGCQSKIVFLLFRGKRLRKGTGGRCQPQRVKKRICSEHKTDHKVTSDQSMRSGLVILRAENKKDWRYYPQERIINPTDQGEGNGLDHHKGAERAD